MRFSALLLKELRECLPWMLLAAIIFILSGLLVQAPYYVFLRSTLPFDVLLSPLSIIGLILFYIFVLH